MRLANPKDQAHLLLSINSLLHDWNDDDALNVLRPLFEFKYAVYREYPYLSAVDMESIKSDFKTSLFFKLKAKTETENPFKSADHIVHYCAIILRGVIAGFLRDCIVSVRTGDTRENIGHLYSHPDVDIDTKIFLEDELPKLARDKVEAYLNDRFTPDLVEFALECYDSDVWQINQMGTKKGMVLKVMRVAYRNILYELYETYGDHLSVQTTDILLYDEQAKNKRSQ